MFENKKSTTEKPSLQFELKVGENILQFKGDNLAHKHVESIIDGILVPNFNPYSHPAPYDRESLEKNFYEMISRPVETVEPSESTNVVELHAPTPEEIEEKAKAESMNDEMLDKYMKKESTSFGIGDILKNDQKTALFSKHKPGTDHSTDDFQHTGIKYKGHRGTPHYRVGYSCPTCGNAGRHYVPDWAKTVSCHNCQTALKVEPANPKTGFGTSEENRDEHGNFFIAELIDVSVPAKHNF